MTTAVVSRSATLRRSLRLALGTASALGFARFAYGLLLPPMRTDLDWTLGESGAMTTANGVGYLAGALVTATVIRRLGPTATFRAGMVATALALALTAVSDVYLLLLVLRAIAGVTGASVFIAGGVIAARMAAGVRSDVPIVVYFAGAGLGVVVSGAAIPTLLGDRPESWPWGWVGLGAAAGLAALVSWPAADAGDQEPGSSAGRGQVRPLSRIVIADVLFAAGYIAYITFLSAFLTAHDAPASQVALVWSLLGFGVVASPALWRRPIDHWTGTWTLTVMLVMLGAASILPILSATPLVVAASAVAYGATFMGVPAAITALIKQRTPAAAWAPTLATFTVLFAAGQAIGPWASGVLADHAGTGATLVWTALLCASAAALSAADRTRTD